VAPPPVAAPAPLRGLARWSPLAWWRARRRARPVFSEDFIAPLRPGSVARFATHHGVEQRPGARGWPQRDVLIDSRRVPAQGTQPLTLYLRTATIEVGNRRQRVLVGSGARAAVMGARLWSRSRLGAAAVLVSALFAAVALAPWLPVPGSETTVQMAMPSASAASWASAADTLAELPAAAPAASGAMPAEVLAAVTEPAPADAPAPAPPMMAAADAAPPRLLAAESPPATGGDIRPRLSERERVDARRDSDDVRAAAAARRQAAGLDPVLAAAAPPAAPRPAPDLSVSTVAPGAAMAAGGPGGNTVVATAPQAPPKTTPQAPPKAAPLGAGGPVFAVAARSTRGRPASEVMLAMLDGAIAGVAQPGMPKTELLQVGQGWRAVWWPFRSRDDAELARAYLAALGISVDVIEF
ncbi:MAG: hypothetical protein Q8N44_18910, partial [Rubrivivax sp.]|nr:hypothetical protein [Rubrivivax sp.]